MVKLLNNKNNYIRLPSLNYIVVKKCSLTLNLFYIILIIQLLLNLIEKTNCSSDTDTSIIKKSHLPIFMMVTSDNNNNNNNSNNGVNLNKQLCRIPNESELGECVLIKSCKAYLKLQSFQDTLTSENINFMKRVQCHNEAINSNNQLKLNFNSEMEATPKVCCPIRTKVNRFSGEAVYTINITTDNISSGNPDDVYLEPVINFTKSIVIKPRILVGDKISSEKLIIDINNSMRKTVKRLIEKLGDKLHYNSDGIINDKSSNSEGNENNRTKNKKILDQMYDDCGRQITNRIYGGEIAELDEYPWLALMFYNSDEFGCSGSLISHNFILTAAHCVSGPIVRKKNGLKHIRLGEFNVKTQPDCIEEENYLNCADASVDVEVDKIFVHPEYNHHSPFKSNDIALVRLKSNVSYTHFIMPICLPKPRNQIVDNPFEDGKYFSVAGWGRTDLFNNYFPNIRSPIKLKLRVPYVPTANCSEILIQHGADLDNKQICAGGELSKDTCAGDSGGPLMYFDQNILRWIAYGVVSYGFSQCGLAGHPAVYTNVTKYMEWISSILQKHT